jgi:hypothetical protein
VPVARYFIFAGGALAALLLIIAWCLPVPATMFAGQTAIDKTVIRIRSARKWPEKIVLDTSQPTLTPPIVEETPTMRPIRLVPDEARDRSNLEAMAELKPDPQPAAAPDHRSQQTRRGVPQAARSRHTARGRLTNRQEQAGGGCCRFGWFDAGQAASNAMLRRRAAFSWGLD